jgi:hypothetical protein
MRYKLTATCPNESVAESFVEFWTRKGYMAHKIQEAKYTNGGLFMGAWSVYRTTKKQTA